MSQQKTVASSMEKATRQRSLDSEDIVFEYTGGTSLTAIGPYSRQRYYFAKPGAQLEVDDRDAPVLAAVPGLRQVKRG